MTAHHAVLVVQVTDVERHNDALPQLDRPTSSCRRACRRCSSCSADSDPEMVAESYWRATHFIGEVAAQYSAGQASPVQKALAEQAYAAICRRLYDQLQGRASARTAK